VKAIGQEDVDEFTPPVGVIRERLLSISICSEVERKPIKSIRPELVAFSIAYKMLEKEAVSLIAMIVLRSSISSSISYLTNFALGVFIILITLFISLRKMKLMSRL
jgi:hypothetical protein